MLVRAGGVQSQTFYGTMGTSLDEADERFGGAGDGLFEDAENGMSRRRGEETHVEGHQI